MEYNNSPFEPKQNPFIGITETEMKAALKRTKEADRLYDKRIKKLMKKLRKG